MNGQMAEVLARVRKFRNSHEGEGWWHPAYLWYLAEVNAAIEDAREPIQRDMAKIPNDGSDW